MSALPLSTAKQTTPLTRAYISDGARGVYASFMGVIIKLEKMNRGKMIMMIRSSRAILYTE